MHSSEFTEEPGDTQGDLGIDTAAVGILRRFHENRIHHSTPGRVIADGNCMFRAVSMEYFGYEKFHDMLRLLTTLEIHNNSALYEKLIATLTKDPAIVLLSYEEYCRTTPCIGSFRDLQMYALSAVVKHAIKSYYPPQGSNNRYSRSCTRTVVGRGVTVANDRMITLMWSNVIPPLLDRNLVPNHFVLLSDHTCPRDWYGENTDDPDPHFSPKQHQIQRLTTVLNPT